MTTNNTVTTQRPTETASPSHRMVFVNLPVADVARSRAFFRAVGYRFDDRMKSDECAGLVLGPNIYAMLLERGFFATFHDFGIAATGQCEVLTCLSATSRAEVDTIVDRAVEAGGTPMRSQDEGYLYGRSYADLDGHIWEIMWMDDAATERGVVEPVD